jgi:hypothetical protein
MRSRGHSTIERTDGAQRRLISFCKYMIINDIKFNTWEALSRAPAEKRARL